MLPRPWYCGAVVLQRLRKPQASQALARALGFELVTSSQDTGRMWAPRVLSFAGHLTELPPLPCGAEKENQNPETQQGEL